ncbi:hypothetical protein F444_21425 [Phytophthora nicotianae P1976]|uniref:Uncharacterized protein n=1 Tax=Phytophthora nicotianae P1976 TaxID=1317066 RepID=A0A080Z131_PHYNI|nr:hypothetical protein F444_21425 [Phytophthora nicotianae P1976]
MPEHHPDQPSLLEPGSPQATPSTLPTTTTCQDAASPNVESLDAITRKVVGEDEGDDSNEGDRLVPSASESEEYDDSGDESFTPDSEVADSDVESLSTASSSSALRAGKSSRARAFADIAELNDEKRAHDKFAHATGTSHDRSDSRALDIWTMDQLVEAVKTAASNATTVYVPHGGDLFKGFKKELTEL